jgi:penicillin G amidase
MCLRNAPARHAVAGMAPCLGSMDYMRARNWDEFSAAMNRWGAPPENQVYADPSGRIAWQTGGLTPIRSRPRWPQRHGRP